MIPALLKSRQSPDYSHAIVSTAVFQQTLAYYLPVVFSALTIASWVVFTAWINDGQFGDNIEQFNWAHGPQWGYWKHPPLPTLLLTGVIAIFGNSPYWAYVLAALCFIGTAFCTWKIAQKLLGEHAASVTVILLSLHQGFSSRAQIYNHNTVLLLMVAAMIWVTLSAVEKKSLLRWGLAGCWAGLALLSKYQAIVPVFGLLFALCRTGVFREPENRHGLALASLAACLIFLPHFFWLCSHDFSTLHYAQNSARNLNWLAKGKRLLHFLFFQIRTYLPALITLGLVIGFVRYQRPALRMQTGTNDIDATPVPVWLWGLVGGPAVFLILMLIVGGIRLESHWGLQTFQFACLALVWRFKSVIYPIKTRYFLIVAILVHVFAMGFYYESYVTKQAQVSHKRIDRLFPAETLAEHVTHDWQQGTHCPLKYVIGPSFEAGLIALYSGSFPAVLEEGDFDKSPWIKPADVAKEGAIEVWTQANKAMADGVMTMPWRIRNGQGFHKVYWHIRLPQQPCTVATSLPQPGNSLLLMVKESVQIKLPQLGIR